VDLRMRPFRPVPIDPVAFRAEGGAIVTLNVRLCSIVWRWGVFPSKVIQVDSKVRK
jgi:hypothetical protein